MMMQLVSRQSVPLQIAGSMCKVSIQTIQIQETTAMPDNVLPAKSVFTVTPSSIEVGPDPFGGYRYRIN